jgi:hypothetical protein
LSSFTTMINNFSQTRQTELNHWIPSELRCSIFSTTNIKNKGCSSLLGLIKPLENRNQNYRVEDNSWVCCRFFVFPLRNHERDAAEKGVKGNEMNDFCFDLNERILHDNSLEVVQKSTHVSDCNLSSSVLLVSEIQVMRSWWTKNYRCRKKIIARDTQVDDPEIMHWI